MQISGRYLEPETAVPLWLLKDDPLFKKVGVRFADATNQNLREIISKAERLAKIGFWADTCAAINQVGPACLW